MEKTKIREWPFQIDIENLDVDDIMIEELEKKIAAAKMRKKDQIFLQQHQNAITQTKDGRWTTNCRDAEGHRHKITCSSREELDRKIIAFYREKEEKASVTFPVVCKEWLERKREFKEVTGPTYTRYMTDYGRFFENNHSLFCRLPLRDLTENDLRHFIKQTITQYELTRKAYGQLRILLRGSLLYAREEGYTNISAGTFFMDLNLSDRIFKHKTKPAPETQTFSDEEVEELMGFLWDEQDIRGLGLILMFQTGMRVGELAALRRDSIRDGKIRITATEETYVDPETGRKICEVVDHAKTDAGERVVILPAGAEKTIKAIRALNPFGEYLFMDKNGRIRAKRFNTWLHRTCKKIGIPERSTHKIRKTYASVLLSSGVDEKLVISQMGHTDIAVTRDIYYFNRDSEADKKMAITRAINY